VIHLVPWCLEDENEPYSDALAALRHRTITHCPALADLLDLKGALPALSEFTSPTPEFAATMAPILPILDRVNVASTDDGRQFLDTTRLDAIERRLREAQSPWTCVASGLLFRLYGRSGSPPIEHSVLISSHADSSYETHFHRRLADSAEFVGTFDNSITNAAVVD